MEVSRDSGTMVSSGRMIFIGGNKSDIGLAIRLPVYRSGMPQSTLEERRAAYRGSVGAGFRVAELMRDVIGSNNPGDLRVRLFDGGPSQLQSGLRGEDKPVAVPAIGEDKLLFDSRAPTQQAAAASAAAPVPDAAFERSLPFEMGGRVWVVQVSACTGRVVGWLDRYVVDGLLNVFSAWTLRAGDRLRRLQTGLPQDYVYGVALGALILFVLAQWRMK